MVGCPLVTTLVDLLEGRLDRQETECVDAHVSCCEACASRLAELTEGEDVLAMVGSVLRRATQEPTSLMSGGSDEPTADFAHRGSLREMPTTDDLAGHRHARHSREPSIALVVPGYVLEEELGRGGMGIVFRARQVSLGRQVALKMIRDGALARVEHRARFRLEAEAVARIRHPNIVQIYDVGEAGGLPYVALELLDGGSLAGRIAGTPQLPRESAALVACLARAIHVAHGVGIVHRDLKPVNILFDGSGSPKVADFGLAKRLDQDEGHTLTGQVLGSPSYMAPEQASGGAKEAGASIDVYSLGAILYEMLVGRPPFKGGTPLETARLVIEQEPVPPTRLRPKTPRDLETICLKCLEKVPHRRFESALALAEDLERYLAGRAIRARRTAAWERAWKWSRRRPAAAALLVLTITAAVLAGGFKLRSDGEREARVRQEEARLDWLSVELARAVSAARQELVRGAVDEARLVVARLQARLEVETPAVLPGLRAELSDLVAAVSAAELEREQHLSMQQRLAGFRSSRDRVFLRDTGLTGAPAENRELVWADATAALEELGNGRPPGSGWRMMDLPAWIGEDAIAKLRADCHWLLLVLADSLDDPARPEGASDRARAAMRILDDAGEQLASPSPAIRLARAALLERLGDAEAASREKAASVTLAPTTAFDHYVLGRHLYRTGAAGRDAAIRCFENVVQLQGSHFGARAMLAVCYLQDDQPRAARGHLDACIQAESEIGWLYLLRGLAHGQAASLAKDRREAEASQERAEGDYARAIALELPRDARYTLLVDRGMMRLKGGRLAVAKRDLEEAAALEPGRFQAYEWLGEVARAEHDPKLAATYLDRAIELAPQRSQLHRNRAYLHRPQSGEVGVGGGLRSGGDGASLDEARERAAAIACLDRALELEPRDSPLRSRDLLFRAKLLYEDGGLEEALASCEQAIESPSPPEEATSLRLAILLELKGHDEVIEACDRMVQKGVRRADVYQIQGLARLGREDFVGAAEAFTLAHSLAPKSVGILQMRGEMYVVLGELEAAARDFDSVLAIEPEHAEARLGRAEVLAHRGALREAISIVDAAAPLGRGQARPLYKAARIYAIALNQMLLELDSGRVPRGAKEEFRRRYGSWRIRGARLLAYAVEAIPKAKRSKFQREVVEPDQILAPIRSSTARPTGERSTRALDPGRATVPLLEISRR